MEITKDVKDLLKNEKLCTLATCVENRPYVSLMNFTYVEEENKVILSTRRDSKKYNNIIKNKRISLLLFSKSSELSATFLGNAMTLDGEEEMYYRDMHMKKTNMPQFILGDNIGVVVFSIEQVIISDKQDRVTYINND
ncbi:pyridoxamine 5'-phosphate oxidase family protein [Isachenkonia alkalipeptolytica]|uniref:Pyridoxamine 5'-phosphate oxidase family protein n=1 Tax=Isachenkonia alkalipeptolytica TaxID=2565777 RepID=A0AA44BDC3_9CLOT|nr:pyridoxamine 5'-phosphate oxidase family protein [Isachenkonia alkalipeptolytica]NBG87748.1 pyridoxamine 5'-phosphate oxidase family protein [Isachenkonia alkalipeptolytica]